jgi:hypothetical protein
MNPMWIYQMLLQRGVPSQQALQMAFQMSQSGMGMGGAGAGSPFGAPGGGSGGTPGAPGGGGGMQDILSQLAMLFEGVQGINAVKKPWDLQMDAAKTGMNPALMNQRIQAMTRPLSQQLVKSVTRATTPGIAEAGLATSPGMSQQMIAEALAPYQIQEQQMGQNAAFQSMTPAFQVGAGSAGLYPSAGVDLVELMKMMGQSYP